MSRVAPIPRIVAGTRIRCKPWREGSLVCPEEFGEACGPPMNGMVCVQLDPEFVDRRDPMMDDGLREVPLNQLEVVPRKVKSCSCSTHEQRRSYTAKCPVHGRRKR